MTSAVERTRRGILSLVRRGRTVAWTPGWMGFGNVLLLAQWAADVPPGGRPRFIRQTPVLEPWLPVLPALRGLVLAPDEIRFTDRRVMPWSESERAGGGRDAVPPHQPIDLASVEQFLREHVLPGSRLREHAVDCLPPDALVVNVRRGDYYSNPEIRLQYGFDVVAYLRIAVAGAIERNGVPPLIQVVSDDVEWCRRELAWMSDVAEVRVPPSEGPISDFSIVSGARRLVITNSTFSYWAAHVSNMTHGDNHAEIWASRFFDRTQNGGRSWLLDERWSIVEDLPGGWAIKDGGGT